MDVLLDLTPLDSAVRYRGIGRYVHELGRALAALPADERGGLDLAALVGLGAGDVSRDLAWAGDPDFRTYPGCHRVYRWRRSRLLGRAVRRSGARLFHHTDPNGSPLRCDVPFVVTCFDLIPLRFPELYLRRPWAPGRQRRLDAARYGRAARVVAISEATRRDLVEELGIEPERIDVVPLGLDHRLFRPDREEGEEHRLRNRLGTNRPFLLYVGGGDARKNLLRLVAAFAESGAAADVDLVVVGMLLRDEERAVRAAADRGGVAGAVRLAGHVPDADVAAAYRACVAHVCPSLYEGFGLTVAESMACGAPTITTARGALPEVAGDAALVVDGEDVDEMADALLRVVADAALRDDLTRRGIDRAARFRWDATARDTVATYRRALEQLA